MNLLRETVSKIAQLDRETMNTCRNRLDNLTKPRGSLGVLEDVAVQVAGITGCLNPPLKRRVIFTMAADHGVVEEGVSAFPQEVTVQMVANFLAGGAGVNVLARHAGARVVVADVGVAVVPQPHPALLSRRIRPGTANLSRGPAMSREEAIASVETGIAIFEENAVSGINLAGTGEMGIGNTTASSALASVFTGASVSQVTGRGTGVGDDALNSKVAVIERALSLHSPDPADPIEVLAKVGGLEIGALTGVILAAAARRVPVVVDGFISGAAALLATAIEPRAGGYLIASHCSAEPGHRIVLQHLGLRPLLDLGLRLGEGTGSCLAMPLVEGAMRLVNEMATFGNAGVSEETSR